MTIEADKAALRTRLRARRRELARAHPHAGEALAGVFRNAGLATPLSAAVYSRQGSEIDPEPLALALATEGVVVALPVVVGAGQPLAFRRRGEVLTRDAYGLPCPLPQEPLVRPQIVFLPLLGFDRHGGRLGQGGGFYDRTLQALRASGPPVRAIGLAYAGQAVERLPVEPLDQPLDGVLTETAYLPFP